MFDFSKYLSDQYVRYFVKNAASNVIGGMVSVIYSLLLPAVVVRHLSSAEFSAWSIGLQVASALSFFSLGIQTALATKLAFLNESSIKEQTNQLLGGAIILLAAGVLGSLVLVVVAWVFYGVFFPKIPAELFDTSRTVALVIGISGSLQLFAMFPSGIYQGQHRNFVPMLIQSGARALTLLVVILVMWIAPGLESVAIAFSLASLMQLPIGFAALRLGYKKIIMLLGSRNRVITIGLFKYCSALSVWNISTILVSGIDIFLVGYFDFASAGTYALAATLMTILGGALSAILSPLATSFAAQCAYPERSARFSIILLRATQLVSVLFCVAIITFHIFGERLLDLWVGKNAMASLDELVLILLMANAIRLTFVPYAMALLGLSLQSKAMKSGFAEGITNLAASIYLGASLGAMGVAFGTLIGAIVGVAGHLCWNFNKTKLLTPNRRDFIFRALVPLWALILTILGTFWAWG